MNVMGFLGNLLSGVLKKTNTSTNNGASGYGYKDNVGRGKYKGPVNLNDASSAGISTWAKEYDSTGITPSRESVTNQTLIDVPAWGYKDFINERVNFQKGLDSNMTSPAWMYFKIFFKFDTKFGLLGGILNTTDGRIAADNTAVQYLHRNMMKTYDKMKDRELALTKFVKTLSYISGHAPWFFKSVKDANLGLNMNLNNLTADKFIEIECMEEATDMRLLTMMDLYKFAAYDAVNQKEIIPENLRKFDLDIVVFQSPIRYIHTSSKDLKGRSTVYKNLNASNYTDRMSFKLFSFQGCEFDYASLGTLLPQSFSNDKPFNSNPTLKIKYDRVYQHNQNEFAGILFGDSGFLWDQSNDDKEYNKVALDNSKTRKEMMKYGNDNKYYYNPASQTYKTLVDASESTISAAMMLIDGKSGLGNLYGDPSNWTSGFKSIANTTKDAYKNIWKNGVKNFLQF